MILRRKPNSDEHNFSERIESHIWEKSNSPWHLPDVDAGMKLRSDGVRYEFTIGKGHLDTGRSQRFTAFAVDIEWTDIMAMIEFIAAKKYQPAVDLLSGHSQHETISRLDKIQSDLTEIKTEFIRR